MQSPATSAAAGRRYSIAPPPPRLAQIPGIPLHRPLKKKKDQPEAEDDGTDRPQWGSKLEFLMSCIATTVGLGNVWRFPFTCYTNGGGAFLIPYLIVLLLVGKPMYYVEAVLGQFSSRNSVECWALCPAMRGVGYAQAAGCAYILSYYVSIVALCFYYLVHSFHETLPWTTCKTAWKNCVPSSQTEGVKISKNLTSSAEYYFVDEVLQQYNGIDNGLGAPLWYLALCLFASWLIIYFVVARGVKSSGKAAYFLAIFPYFVMIILFISAVVRPGAGAGIKYFITPDWNRLGELKVWYSAVTQVFFSLSVCTGAIIMFSSYNTFRQNLYRDAMIVTTLDTLTSLLSGFTIFGILGNLAYTLGQPVHEVVGTGGTGLAFVSYPDAIAKSLQPQLFSVLFFLMMTVLGVGSAVAFMSTLSTAMMDAFPKVRPVIMSALCCFAGFCAGLVYITRGGQYILELVDYYGGTFLILFCATIEIVALFWIYGLENICLDIQFMLHRKVNKYWRFCWGIITPSMMFIVLVYALFSFGTLKFGDYTYPVMAYVAGYILVFSGLLVIPCIMIYTMHRNKSPSCAETVKKSFVHNDIWGPRRTAMREEWRAFKAEAKNSRKAVTTNKLKHIWLSLTGGYKYQNSFAK